MLQLIPAPSLGFSSTLQQTVREEFRIGSSTKNIPLPSCNDYLHALTDDRDDSRLFILAGMFFGDGRIFALAMDVL